jgi:hypothetical protein
MVLYDIIGKTTKIKENNDNNLFQCHCIWDGFLNIEAMRESEAQFLLKPGIRSFE